MNVRCGTTVYVSVYVYVYVHVLTETNALVSVTFCLDCYFAIACLLFALPNWRHYQY